MGKAPHGASRRVRILSVNGTADRATERDDSLAVEEPLEIRVVSERKGRRRTDRLVVTMRSPGHDLELAAGFLLAEGIVKDRSEIWRIDHCPEAPEPDNVVEAHLEPSAPFDIEEHRRNVVANSSCGVCGKESIEQLQRYEHAELDADFELDPSILHGLPGKLESAQSVFSRTGGLHACGLFDRNGTLEFLREDVGRHNAVDKVIGRLFLDGGIPASGKIVLVSGRTSFELVHKTAAAGIPALLAVSAPSSLAVDTARACGMTLVGFLRDDRFNVYSGPERIAGS